MSSYQAKNLLRKAALSYQRQKEAVSKMEIRKRINEIKYLSAQKKVPKISLRKEVIHLENTLEGVFELEKALLRQQQRESAKVNALKAEIAALKKLLAVSGDQHLKKKVDRIAHVLDEFKAREEIKKDVVLSRKIAVEEPSAAAKHVLGKETISRVHHLQDRLKALKSELEISKELGKDKEAIRQIEQKILLMERNLGRFYQRHPQLLQEKMPVEAKPVVVESPVDIHQEKVKHRILFEKPEEKEEELSEEEKLKLERELPLPPPPRMAG